MRTTNLFARIEKKKAHWLRCLVVFLLVVMAGRNIDAQNQNPRLPMNSWKPGNLWVLDVEQFACNIDESLKTPSTIYQLNAFVTGVEKVGGEPCWRVVLQTGQSVPLQLPDQYYISVGNKNGWPRKIRHIVMLKPVPAPVVAASAVGFHDPQWAAFMTTFSNFFVKPSPRVRDLAAWLESFGDVTLITGAPAGFPVEILPIFDTREIKSEQPNTLCVLKKHVDGVNILLEASLWQDGAEQLLIRQKWLEGEPWWREYERYVNGRKDLRARRLSPPPAGSSPVATKPDKGPTLPSLVADKRLHVSLSFGTDRPDLVEILNKLRETTGLDMELAPELQSHQPKIGGIQPSKKGWPAFTIMQLVAAKQLEDGHWEKTERGYRLLGKSLVEPSGDQNRSAVRFTFWLRISGAVLGISLLSLGAVWFFRKRRKMSQT